MKDPRLRHPWRTPTAFSRRSAADATMHRMDERGGLILPIVILFAVACSTAGSDTGGSEQGPASAPSRTDTTAPVTTIGPEPVATTSTTTTTLVDPPLESFQGEEVLLPGSYRSTAFAVPVTFNLGEPLYVDDLHCYLCFEQGTDQPSWLALHSRWRQQPVGEVVAYLTSHPHIVVETTDPDEIGGWAGVRLRGSSPAFSMDFYPDTTEDCEWWIEPDYLWQIYVVDVAGQTVVITIETPAADASFVASAEAIIASLGFPRS